MRNKSLILIGMVVFVLLITGIYTYAMNCGKEEGEGKCKTGEDKCDMQHSGGQASDKHECKGDNPNCPNCLIKTADKLIKNVSKTKDINALMTHCQLMISKSLELVTECDSMVKNEHPDAVKIAANAETAAKLLKKVAEITEKCHSIMPKDSKMTSSEKVAYVCPMGCETSDKPGKCSKCGMTLEKKTITEAAVYTCSMHPEVVSDKPGKCPKCGMNLVKK